MSVKTMSLKTMLSMAAKATSEKRTAAVKPVKTTVVNIGEIHKVDGVPALLDGNMRVAAMLELGMKVEGTCKDGTHYEILLPTTEVIGTCTNEDGALKIHLDDKQRFVFREIAIHDNV
ncbi:hypothetical protein LMH73_009305 [Vibrio splendidus]|nr:hypothetical protein [Vibrio splendidus]MCC4881854.1 hypothetical protein [Vibrio splendidus]